MLTYDLREVSTNTCREELRRRSLQYNRRTLDGDTVINTGRL